MDMMQAAAHLYQRMGFMHLPELDLRPAQGILVKGYHLNLR